jgi:hypothetical protein
MKSILLMTAFAGSLSACGLSRQDLLARDRQDCAGFGYQIGSPSYADCLLRLDLAHQGYSHDHHH